MPRRRRDAPLLRRPGADLGGAHAAHCRAQDLHRERRLGAHLQWRVPTGRAAHAPRAAGRRALQRPGLGPAAHRGHRARLPELVVANPRCDQLRIFAQALASSIWICCKRGYYCDSRIISTFSKRTLGALEDGDVGITREDHVL
ncbi:unnamed protein product [Heterosigma akashiwo]